VSFVLSINHIERNKLLFDSHAIVDEQWALHEASACKLLLQCRSILVKGQVHNWLNFQALVMTTHGDVFHKE
jgi:hypothetical protein